jgi:hypothetical protein
LSQHLYERVWEYSAKAIKSSIDAGDDIACEASVYDYCLEQIQTDNTLNDDAKGLATELLEWLTTFTAADVRKQSLRYYKVEATFPVILI